MQPESAAEYIPAPAPSPPPSPAVGVAVGAALKGTLLRKLGTLEEETERGVRTMTTEMRAGLGSRRMPKRTIASSLLLSASVCVCVRERERVCVCVCGYALGM